MTAEFDAVLEEFGENDELEGLDLSPSADVLRWGTGLAHGGLGWHMGQYSFWLN